MVVRNIEENLVFYRNREATRQDSVVIGLLWQRRKHDTVIAKISQGTLADIVGTTRSRVSFFLNKFRKLGLIQYNGNIYVHSSLLNVVLHS